MNPLEFFRCEPNASESEIESLWLALVSHYRPGGPLERPVEYDQAMEAWLTLIEQTWLPGFDGHRDWLPVYLAHHRQQAEDCPDPSPDFRADYARGTMPKVPGYVDYDRLLPLDGLDVRAVIGELLPLQEFTGDRSLPEDPCFFDIVWRWSKWTSGGATVHGSCKPIPRKERELWPRAGVVPWFRLTLSLPHWLVLDDLERRRLVHHELCHAKLDEGRARSVPHAMEENLETIARFGVRPDHAEVLAAALAHPDTMRLIEAVDWDGQQGCLFPPLPKGRLMGGTA